MGSSPSSFGDWRSTRRLRAWVAAGVVALVAASPALGSPGKRLDRDRDGLRDRYERHRSHTSPTRKDTDRDGLSDGREVRRSHTNPRRRDTDRDHLSDGREIRRHHTQPRRRDTDGDHLRDGFEVRASHTNPRRTDTDRDRLSDSWELFVTHTNPRRGDTDGDGISDFVETSGALQSPSPDGRSPRSDKRKPDTSISAGPPGSTTSSGASFSFAGTDNVGVSGYECQLDASSWAGCWSPKAYSGLAVGSHTFRVRAKDAAGNVDASPASLGWNVAPPADTTPPDTSISSGPSGTVASGDASFGFGSSESGSTFECRLDAGSWAACGSPKSYSGLADGSHTFEVRARDAAGNVDASPASRSWTVSAGGGGGGGCSQTLSVGANVASAVAGAANGSVICLNSGDYGTVNLWDISRSGFVTLRSASGRGAVLKPSVGNADYIRLDGLTLHDGLVNSCSTNIQFANSTFQPDKSGLYVDGSACPATTHNVLIDNVTFANVDLAGFEGRLSFRDINGATVTNSFFGSNGYGDGIQTGGNNRNLTIGPNNTFDGIVQSFCDANGGAHCDAIQLQGGGVTAITGNYFKNGDTYIMAPDGSSAVTTTNNVFDGTGRGYEYKIQFGSAANPVFRHNTLANTSAAFDSKPGMPATTNAQVKDNVWAKGYGQIKTSNGSGCSGCTFAYNLFDNAANARGTNNVIATPSFSGGATPTSYPGWRLTTTSPGHNAASDATDTGIP